MTSRAMVTVHAQTLREAGSKAIVQFDSFFDGVAYTINCASAEPAYIVSDGAIVSWEVTFEATT